MRRTVGVLGAGLAMALVGVVAVDGQQASSDGVAIYPPPADTVAGSAAMRGRSMPGSTGGSSSRWIVPRAMFFAESQIRSRPSS